MRHWAFERLAVDGDEGVVLSHGLALLADPAIQPSLAATEDPPVPDENPPPTPDVPPPVLVDGDGTFLPEWAPEGGEPFDLDLDDLVFAPAAADDIDPTRILRDRPDVYAAFYSEFYGPNNDRNSPAWHDRVGGDTPEDYARYWYTAHGRYEGYTQEAGGAAAPAEGPADPPQGRNTLDGIPLSKILSDRPDVFQAFFTEYYGPNNDRHSEAWVLRVGGSSVEDYANYWYNAHGRMEGYVPSGRPARPEPLPDAPGYPEPNPSEDESPIAPPVEDPSLDPWNHPAIYPDWQPPYPGWQPPQPGTAADSASSVLAADDAGAMRTIFDPPDF